jgi:hypothetical protein|tara:strand:+ start:526 stop:897 length:372 start_codon:yes stop_codon:yes gene_type:complete
MSFLEQRDKDRIVAFIRFVKDELGIKTMPSIKLLNGRGVLKTTAHYNYSQPTKVIKVNSKNRHIVDIMRSCAHELVHHSQYEQGLLDGPKPPDIGGNIEDEANSRAGQFIKLYSKMDSTIYDE